jgi:hypothetical protein
MEITKSMLMNLSNVLKRYIARVKSFMDVEIGYNVKWQEIAANLGLRNDK